MGIFSPSKLFSALSQELTETRTRLQEKQQELWENALDGSETRKKYY